MEARTVGIIGGGQLGRMLIEVANRLNIDTVILDAPNSPAKQISNSIKHIDGSFTNAEDLKKLSEICDVMTFEIEHVNVESLKNNTSNTKIYPSIATIELIKDKLIQKQHLIQNGIDVAESIPVASFDKETLLETGSKLGFPFMMKTRTLGYDGRGNFVVKNTESIDQLLKNDPNLKTQSLYAEKWAPFTKELAVMVVRSINNKVYSYPTVETVHVDNICHTCYAPARVDENVQSKARLLAEKTIQSLPSESVGVFGVELFYLENGELLVNEIAPRPHNSGHYTINACIVSQFEAHLRAILGLPLPEGFTSMTTNITNCIMLNVLGKATDKKDEEKLLYENTLNTPGASLYLYGKESRPKRKLGHINIVGNSMQECEAKLQYILGQSTENTTNKKSPEVGIIMGSDSDLPVMSQACKILERFDVPFEVTIVSAHRTPQRMFTYAHDAHQRGIKVIIAGAGGAAHLPGMVAAMTPLPVIGVPVKGSTLDGVDSLYSIVQMPRGIPVASVAINNSTNAAILAVRMLGISNPKYIADMKSFMEVQEEEVIQKAAILEKDGYEEYLHNYKK
ncbi:hypothetical protein TBLA_0A02680 [Henningerozyma blattae CBS 6284]|uniref:Phosphoribosylaminoimidazole carboxylase n=1 Tax=Henningerozyma blattae (strain ATCC 34711 / CBS 6284 / DSM 70876 / NBRC 10599 / NRRL Y-10934 / UCD 77-7) TaxID=1071380 RepID=I2GVB5_HENB6|nr:hypothetical protein TBLA_0A02680 [Tetrapisispora blattae CBS 6284]CCH58067.1 hypothetical protein TBLA_0A02680 [Tetrapisispora blattae CBS 6284]